MRKELLSILRCPKTNQKLKLESNFLISQDGKNRYIIKDGVPRFVDEKNYANSFGLQWNLFPKTQLDSYSGHNISANRFWESTKWTKKELENKWVLDVGCGSGRFTETALAAGAKVVAIDYSSAVDACNKNFKNHPNLFVCQANIYELPFASMTFSYIYSLGVLQHTPDPKKGFQSLPPLLKKDGKICVDYYEKSYKSLLHTKYWLRPLTKRIPKQKLFNFLYRITPTMLRWSVLIGKLPVFGNILKRIIPVANYHGIFPLNNQQHNEWSLLDTFDWLSPDHDHPQTAKTITQWMEEACLKDIEVVKAGHLVSRGKK